MLMGLWGSRHSDIVLLDVDNGPTSMENSIGLAGGANAGDVGSIPGSGRSPGGGTGNRLQYSWQENFEDRIAWWATVHGIVKSWTQLSY